MRRVLGWLLIAPAAFVILGGLALVCWHQPQIALVALITSVIVIAFGVGMNILAEDD